MWTAYSILKRTNYIEIELNIFTIIQHRNGQKSYIKENDTHLSEKRILIYR